jgi:hypothetical protein
MGPKDTAAFFGVDAPCRWSNDGHMRTAEYRLFDDRLGMKDPVCFETFPHAIACVLSGKLMSAENKRADRRALLEAAGVVTGKLGSIDFIDAALCARAAHRFAQAFFFTTFLYKMAFFGWGPPPVYVFAITQGYTYYKTRSLLFLVILHFMVDIVLFYMIANRWFPGWGW